MTNQQPQPAQPSQQQPQPAQPAQQQAQQQAQQAQQTQPAQPAQQQAQQVLDAMRNPNAFVAPMPANGQSMISFNTTAPEQMQAPASYQSIIDQQNEQIAALIAQNQALNGQITKMVQNGAQFYQPQQPAQTTFQPMQPQPTQTGYQQAQNPMQQFNPPALSSNQDWSLEALGKEIGKPRKEV